MYPNPAIRAEIKARCRDIYGTPREEVEEAIFARTGGRISLYDDLHESGLIDAPGPD